MYCPDESIVQVQGQEARNENSVISMIKIMIVSKKKKLEFKLKRRDPAYKLSKLFTQKINNIAPLPNTFNIKNTTDLLQNLQDTPIYPHFTFASLDITNLHPNITI